MSNLGTGPGALVSGTCLAAMATHHRRQRQVDEEHQPPGHRVDQPPAKKRTYSGGHAAEAGPRADGGHPVILGEGGLQDGQAARGQQRPADALQGARRDQHPDVRRHPAQQRRDGEPHGADDEHLPPPVAVPERAAEQQQPGQGERVGVHHPLQAGHAGVELPADGRERDADHGRVERGHARAEHGGGHHPPARRGRQPQGRGRRRCFGHETNLARTAWVSAPGNGQRAACLPHGQTGWRGGRASARLPSQG